MGSRRKLPGSFAVVCLVATACLFAFALPPVAGSAESSDWQPTVPQWLAFEVGPHERSITLLHEEVGCADNGLRNVSATATEAARAVSVAVSGELYVGPPPVAEPPCIASRSLPSVMVRLKRPLAGRSIEGTEAETLAPQEGALRRFYLEGAIKMPNLTGFAPADAQHVLYRLGLGWHVATRRHGAGLGRVSDQRPRPGAPVRGVGTALLVLTP